MAGEDNFKFLMDTVEEHGKTLSDLKNVPLLMKELADKVNRAISGEDPPPSIFSPEMPNLHEREILSESDDLGLDDVMQSLHKHINEEQDKDLQSGQTQKELDEILEDIEKSAELGPEVLPNISQGFVKTVVRPLTKETVEKLKQNVLTPSNCKEFVTPKMNQEIWKCLPSHARLDDIKQQQIQTSLNYGIVSLAKIANSLAGKADAIPKEMFGDIMKQAIDGANLLGNQIQDINKRRRLNVKKFIGTEYADICTRDFPHSEWLFGGDLSESLKQSKATAAIVKQSGIGHRYKPYTTQRPSSSYAPLNYHRSPQITPRRGNWSNRGRQPYSQFRQSRGSYQQRPPFQSFQSSQHK